MKRFLPLTLLALLLVAGVGCDSATDEDLVTFDGTIVNVTGLGVDDATVAFENGDDSYMASTDTDGQFSVDVPDGTYDVTIEAPGYTPATTSVSPGDPIEITLRGPSNVTGRVVGSQSGDPLSEARLSFTRGSGMDVDTSAAAVDLEVDVDDQGTFRIEGAPTGTYLCVIRAPGFSPTIVENVDFEEGETNLGNSIPVVQGLDAGEIQIVLSWAEQPRDLDTHLTGPNGQGGRFHVYYVDQTFEDVAELDRDDTSGEGPETTTITPRYDGLYRYSVFNYSTQDNTGSQGIAGEITDSQPARVQVYNEDGLVRTYTAPPSTPGNTWRVLEMTVSDGEISIEDINTYVTADGSGDIGVFRLPGK